MKVSCQSCGAQYNLPDDKVRGRKAKVRCKKCSAQIIVDGTSVGEDDDDEATRVMMSPALSSSGEPMWTVNLSDEEQLDMTESELIAGWRDGKVTEDAYVWREGMDEWLPILESTLAPTLKAQKPASAPINLAPTPGPAAVSPSTGLGSSPKATSALGSSPLASSPKLGSSPIASPTPPPASTADKEASGAASSKPKSQRSDDTSKAFSFALSGGGASSTKKASRPPGAGGMFGAAATPPPGAVTAASAASSSASSAASSENSVMFSLDALKAAAAVEPKRSSVRALAGNEARVDEDILTLGAPSRFDDNAMPLIDIEVPPPAPRVNAPVAAAPLGAPPQKKSPWGLIAVGVIAVGGMAGAYILGQQGKSEAPVVAQNDSTQDVQGARHGEEADKPSEPSATEAPATAAAETSAAPAPSAAPVAQSPSPNVGSASKSGGGTAAAKPADKPTEASPKPAPSPAPAAAPAPKPSGAAFNVAAAKAALNTAAANAAGCRAPAGPNGTGKVQVTFAPSGNVTSALIVSGPFGGTPVGSCVARTFRAAKVPAFDGSPMTVSKSFTIN